MASLVHLIPHWSVWCEGEQSELNCLNTFAGFWLWPLYMWDPDSKCQKPLRWCEGGQGDGTSSGEGLKKLKQDQVFLQIVQWYHTRLFRFKELSPTKATHFYETNEDRLEKVYLYPIHDYISSFNLLPGARFSDFKLATMFLFISQTFTSKNRLKTCMITFYCVQSQVILIVY